MISRALNALGLVTRVEHERIVDELDMQAYSRWRDAQTELDKLDAKFKLAATDLAKQAEEIAKQDGIIESMAWEIRGHEETIASLRHDAQKWRNSLKRSRDRKRAAKSGDRK